MDEDGEGETARLLPRAFAEGVEGEPAAGCWGAEGLAEVEEDETEVRWEGDLLLREERRDLKESGQRETTRGVSSTGRLFNLVTS